MNTENIEARRRQDGRPLVFILSLWSKITLCAAACVVACIALAADSPSVVINQDRLARLKAATMPKFDQPLHFNTPEADAILAALEVFPSDNPWNIPVDAWPVAPNSAAMIAAIGGAKPLRYNPDMGFVLVPPGQKKVEVRINAYAGESDPGLLLALPSAAFYVGALGSPATNAKRRQRLLDAGLAPAVLDRLHAPIGLDLGGRSPEEIALSIMAQVVSARHARK